MEHASVESLDTAVSSNSQGAVEKIRTRTFWQNRNKCFSPSKTRLLTPPPRSPLLASASYVLTPPVGMQKTELKNQLLKFSGIPDEETLEKVKIYRNVKCEESLMCVLRPVERILEI